MKKTFLLSALFLFCLNHSVCGQIISTVAGDSTGGYNGDNISAVTAELFQPDGVAVDGSGNVYIGDHGNNRIRKVSPSGVISTIAGTGVMGFSGDNNQATSAKLNAPIEPAVDNLGNIYFSDTYNQRVRRINNSGIITTIAGTDSAGYNGDNIPATMAKLNFPHGVAVDGSGNVFIADFYNNRIRMVNTSGIITTIAGTGTGAFSGDNGPATAAEMYQPYGIALDARNNLYIADFNNLRIRKVSSEGIITTIAGNGSGGGISGDGGLATNAAISPTGVGVDNFGNIYVADAVDHIIRRIDKFGIISTVAGTGEHGYNGDGQLAIHAELYEPTGVATNNEGDVYISDFANNRIRRITSTVFVPTINVSHSGISLYPNPSNGSFTFNLSTNTNEQIRIIITNIAGEKIQEIASIANTDAEIHLNVPTGLYFLTAITAHGRWSEKLMVERTSRLSL